jgi:hypothetical protein
MEKFRTVASLIKYCKNSKYIKYILHQPALVMS